MPMQIKVLSPELAAKIAAGEVVERPASVVKELVENALDAGATQVAIDVRGGGIDLIRVSDNGWGLASDEAALAFERHATSKIATEADLEAIASLGFRGEALPSIAAVAQVSLLSRTIDEEAGVHLVVKGGRVVEQKRQGCPLGTTVTVRDLFHTVPARRKFLRSATTESGHISHLVSQMCLAFPEVRFTLTLDGRQTIQTSGSGQLRDAFLSLYGLEAAQAMLEVRDDPDDEVQVWGLVSSPSLNRSNRSQLSFFVNRRWVQSRSLVFAVEEAYHGLLMTGRHPVAVINIQLPLQEVDVNVHPAKSEVRFRRERDVFAAVQKAVRAALIGQMPIPSVSGVSAHPSSPASSMAFVDFLRDAGKSPAEAPPLLVEPRPERNLPVLRVLGQLSETYIIAEGPDGMYLIDQHTAHERVLFEKVTAQRAAQKVEVQGLLEPLTVELTPAQDELVREQGELLREQGFALEPFGERAYLVRAVPALLRTVDIKDSVREVLDLVQAETTGDWQERLAISLACHGAVRAGKSLGLEEMRELVRQLEGCSSPRTCPHGRPTMVHLSAAQLEKEFGRR